MGSARRRVAVVGAGVVGACVGWNLACAGGGDGAGADVDVVFVDAARPGEGVTNWSFSWVNASNKTERRSYFDLNVAGIAAHRDLADVVGADRWWYPTGHLRWAGDPVAQAKMLDTAALLAEWGYSVQLSTGAEVRRGLEPAVMVPDEAPVVFYPDEGWVHGRHLVDRLVGLAVGRGAECRFGAAVREIGRAGDGGAFSVVLGDGSSVEADVVVNAAGPAAAAVAGLLGRELPMRHEPGAVARLACSPVPIGRAMHAPRIEIRPDGPETMVLHSREVDALIGPVHARTDTDTDTRTNARTGRGTDTDSEPEGPAELGRRLQEMARAVVPGLGESGTGSRIVETRVSNRPIPADGFPSVGAVPGIPGYYEAVSHSGITLGPVIGRLLAAEIVGGERDGLLAEFSPGRIAA